MYFKYYSFIIDTGVSFSESLYLVDEDDGSAQPVLVLSNPQSIDIIIQVFGTYISAIGEYCGYTTCTPVCL